MCYISGHRSAKIVALVLAMPVAADVGEPTADIAAKSDTIAPLALSQLASLGVFEKVYFQSTSDGAVHAKGSNFKATFTGAGLTYRPLGGEPMSFTLTSATVGGQPLALKTDSLPIQEGDSVSIDRGAFIEHFALTHNSVEQLFTIDQLPAHGDLVLRIAAIAPNMIATTKSQGLEFKGEAGEVTYSKAVLVDAMGASTGLSTQLNDGVIEIRVNGSALNRAAFPITIDPVINANVPYTEMKHRKPDVAFDATTSRFIIVAETNSGPDDGDVYSVITTIDGTPLLGTFNYVDLTPTNWRNPKVANHNASNWFLVVAERGVAPTRGIWGSAVNPATGTPGPQTELVYGGGGGEKINPDIGGSASVNTPSPLLVVWEWVYMADNHHIIGHRFTEFGQPVGDYIFIGTHANSESNPAVSKGNLDGDWMVVWQTTYTAADEDIYGARVNGNGLISSPQQSLNSSFVNHTSPEVSSPMNGKYLVTYEQNGAIVVQLINSTMATTQLTTLEALGNNPWNQQRWLPTVDADGDKFIVGYSEVFFGNNADWDVYADSLCVTSDNTLKLAEFHKNLALSGARDQHASVATCWSAGGIWAYPALFSFTYSMLQATQYGQIGVAAYSAPTTCCPTDVAPIGGDGVINVADLLAVISQWQTTGSCSNCTADPNSDGFVNVVDLLAVLNAWGVCQ